MNSRAGRLSLWLPLAAYGALVTLLALTHDMWRDEVRAYSVATRAASWGEMLGHLGEEGHPALWYVILRAGYAVTHSPLVLPVAAAVIAIATAYLILRYAPFPLWARLLAVFGAFLGYELSVVARNYGIGVLLLVVACVFYRSRTDRPWPLAVALALMANTSVHAAVASALLLLLWMSDALDGERRREMLRLPVVAAFLIVVIGIVIALVTANPPAEMAFAFSLVGLSPSAVLDAILIDPGQGLEGSNGANLVASGEIPWHRLGIDADVPGRILVNAAVVSVAWGLRRHRRILVVLILAVLSFEILFRVVYTGALRHEGLLAFLMVSLCWIAVEDSREADRPATARQVALGLLPLLALQALALPFTAWRHAIKPESMGRELARVIAKTPRYANAVLMSEPEPMMETMPYYVANPVYMPRQRELDYRTYFDRGAKRQSTLTISELGAIADSVACAMKRPVLLSIGHRRFLVREEGEMIGPYESVFRWTAEEKKVFEARVRPLDWFPGTTSDENYRTYEVSVPPACI